MILNFDKYLTATYAQINPTLTNTDGSTRRYYTKVEESTLDTVKSKLTNVLEEAFDNNLITQDEFRQMEKVQLNST